MSNPKMSNISKDSEGKAFNLSGDFSDVKTGFTRTGESGVRYS
jgi:hypothetical protein